MEKKTRMSEKLHGQRVDPGTGEVTGFACRKCGCRHLDVLHTYDVKGGKRRRRRQCRHCGHTFTTVETSVSDAGRPEKES